jgi:hypothetical protein
VQRWTFNVTGYAKVLLVNRLSLGRPGLSSFLCMLPCKQHARLTLASTSHGMLYLLA